MFGDNAQSPTTNPILNTAAVARLLNVEILEGKGLASQTKNGTSDPYANVSLLDLRGGVIKKESFKTSQKNGTLTPTWNEKFSFGKFCSVS